MREIAQGERGPAVPLREIVYLDRDRVDSYVSQLTGGVTIEEASSATSEKKFSGGIRAGIKVVEFEAGGEKGSGAEFTTTRVPAHAVVATLEGLLRAENLLTNASEVAAQPGQIVIARGETTFESWELLAKLGDSVQGIATLAAKLHARRRVESSLAQMRRELQELEKLAKRYGPKSDCDEHSRQLAAKITSMRTGYEIVDAGYINDVKDIVNLFFQDQNRVNVSTREQTFVGLLRRDCFIGGTADELFFTYGSRPSSAFTALLYVAELGHDQELRLEELGARIQAFASQQFSLAMLQEVIRQTGSVVLQLAEELRRPTGVNTVFVVPLAIFREISSTSGLASS